MKIAFDQQIFNQQQYGGISRYFTELTRHINQTQHQAKIFAGLHINRYINDLPNEQVVGKLVEPFPKTNRIRRTLNDFYIKPKVKQWQSDIYHHTYYLANYAKGMANVITVYDMIHELYPSDFHPSDKTQENKRQAITQADHIICISQATKKDLMRILNIPEAKISVVYLGFLNNSYNHQNLIKDSNKPYLLYVGARGGYKNFRSLIIAYSQSNFLKANMDIIAFGGGEFTEAEKALFKQLNLADTQIQNKQGNDKVLTSLYQHAQAFIYPSLYEGFGIPPLEAMAHNCPVVCSNTSSIPEVVGEAGEYFDPTNIDDMQYKIENLIQSNSLQRELQVKGQQRIQQFSWQICADETLQVYQKII